MNGALMPCEVAARTLIPSIRAAIAFVMIKEYNITRYEAAKKLGTTPAAITNYLEGRRGSKYLDRLLSDRRLYSLVSEAARIVAEGRSSEYTERYRRIVCSICGSINKYSCADRH